MALVTIEKGNLVVSVGWFEAIQALHGSFTIPLTNVRGATDDPNYIRAGLGLRSPGTGFPGFIARGTFRKIGEKVLSLWGRNQEIVVVELQDSKWDRLVIGCENAKGLANLINEAVTSEN